jgi:hypothetical protein
MSKDALGLRRPARWRPLLLPLFFLGGCSHETHQTGPAEIKVDQVDRSLVGLHKITCTTGDLGYLETWRYGPEEKHGLRRVTDLKRNPLGYVDDSGRAYRYTAHSGTQLVAQSDDLNRNLRAVLAIGDVDRFELVDQVPAPR